MKVNSGRRFGGAILVVVGVALILVALADSAILISLESDGEGAFNPGTVGLLLGALIGGVAMVALGWRTLHPLAGQPGKPEE